MPSESLRINWRTSPGHLFFLSTFLHPRTVEGLGTGIDWKLVLGEQPEKAARRLLSEGALIRASLREHLAYKFKVPELKEMLKRLGLPSSGRKSNLIMRLIQSNREDMKQAVTDITVLKCSEQGQIIAEQYLTDNGEMIVQHKVLTPDGVRKLFEWILKGAASGAIGAATYDVLQRIVERIQLEKRPLALRQSSSIAAAPPDDAVRILPTKFWTCHIGPKATTETPERPKIAELDEGIRQHPCEWWRYFSRGSAYDRLGKHQQAIADYTVAIELNPESIITYVHRGYAHESQGDYRSATGDYRKAVKLPPKRIVLWNIYYKGYAHERLREYREAIALYSRYVRMLPGTSGYWPYFRRGYVYEKLGDYQSAITDYQTAIRKYDVEDQKDLKQIKVRLGMLRELKNR